MVLTGDYKCNLVYVLKGVLVFIFIITFSNCSSINVIESRSDYHLLKDIEDFEYTYSLNEGIKNRLLGNYSHAVFFFNRCIEIFPFSDVSYHELSKIYFISGDLKRSVNYAIKSIEIDPGNIWYYHHLGIIYMEIEDYSNAINLYGELAETYPDDYDIYYTLANIYLAAEQYSNALDILQELENKFGIEPKFSLPKKQIYLQIAEYELAHDEINKLIQHFPDEPHYLVELAEFYDSMNMNDEAIGVYEQLFDAFPGYSDAKLSIASYYFKKKDYESAFLYIDDLIGNTLFSYEDILILISSLLQDDQVISNYHDKIEEYFFGLQKMFPGNSTIDVFFSDFYLNLGDYSKAENIIKKLYFDNPLNEIYAEKLIGILSFKGEYSEVVKLGKQMTEDFSDNIIIHYSIGLANQVLGNTENAIIIFEKCLSFDVSDERIKSNIYSSLGELYHNKQLYDKSDEFFEMSLDIDSTNLLTLNNFAYYLALRDENLERAHEYSYFTIIREPDNPSFLDTYAWVLYKLEQYTEALKYIEMAYINGGNKRYEIVKHYGEILTKLKKYDEADIYFKKADLLKNADN